MSTSNKTDDAPHPLQRAWTLWYDNPSTFHDNWELALKPIMTVRTVEDFFLMLKYMKPVDQLRASTQYHFFQEAVKPMWEDDANKNGGKLSVNISHAHHGESSNGESKMQIDEMWRNVLMAIVGEYLEDSNVVESQITGVAVAKRKQFYRFAVWVKDANATDAIKRLKERLVATTGVVDTIEFLKHTDKQ